MSLQQLCRAQLGFCRFAGPPCIKQIHETNLTHLRCQVTYIAQAYLHLSCRLLWSTEIKNKLIFFFLPRPAVTTCVAAQMVRGCNPPPEFPCGRGSVTSVDFTFFLHPPCTILVYLSRPSNGKLPNQGKCSGKNSSNDSFPLTLVSSAIFFLSV